MIDAGFATIGISPTPGPLGDLEPAAAAPACEIPER
jgi:hypothetical protein